jgi:succinate dehydrogenase / fumarate reductase cytochrome b subunit
MPLAERFDSTPAVFLMLSTLLVARSSVGKKILIGLTGLVLVGYLILHIAGNLLIFFGPHVFNSYSHALLGNPLLIPIEIGLLLVFLLHIGYTVTIYVTNRQARPVLYIRKTYAVRPPSRKSFASSTMIFSGLWLLVFVLVHVKGFKYGTGHSVPGSEIRDLYRLEMELFSKPSTVAFYVLSMLMVGSHLWHGIVSGLQSLGAPWPGAAPRAFAVGRTLTLFIAGGFIFIILWAYLWGARS